MSIFEIALLVLGPTVLLGVILLNIVSTQDPDSLEIELRPWAKRVVGWWRKRRAPKP
jgi:hypothetical protein